MRRKYHLAGLGILVILLISLIVFAATPTSYSITFVTTNENQEVTMEERCWIFNNTKMRIELYEGEGLSEIGLYHKERKAWYTLYPSSKLYSLHRITEKDWDWGQKKVNIDTLGKKRGAANLLGYPCDIYEKTEGSRLTITWLAHDVELPFKIIEKEKGKVITQTEVKEFKLIQPDASLFEIPGDYVDAMSL